MKIDQLEDFIIVAKRQNITRSAAEIHTSQPSLSMRIASIEKEVGCPLFERSNSGLKLNESGRIFLERAQQIIELYREGVEKARAARKIVPVRVSIDISSDSARALPNPSRMPFRVIELDINSPAVDAVASCDVDMAIDSDYSQIDELQQEALKLGITYVPIGESSNFLAMMADNPLARKESLRRVDLDGQTIVVNSGAHLDRWSKVIQHIAGPDVHLGFRLNQTESYGDAALADFGSALYICGSDSTRAILGRRHDVAVYDLLDGRPITFPTALVCRTEDYRDAESYVGQFIRTFLDNIGKLN